MYTIILKIFFWILLPFFWRLLHCLHFTWTYAHLNIYDLLPADILWTLPSVWCGRQSSGSGCCTPTSMFYWSTQKKSCLANRQDFKYVYENRKCLIKVPVLKKEKKLPSNSFLLQNGMMGYLRLCVVTSSVFDFEFNNEFLNTL